MKAVRHNPLFVLLGLGLAIRLFFLVNLPLYPERGFLPGYNDEPLHLEYVRYIAQYNRLPVWTVEESEFSPLIDEFGQTPLYYLMGRLPYAIAEAIFTGLGLYGVRFLSMLFGMTAGIFVYWFGVRVAGREVGLAALAAMMLSPNTVIFTSIATNDSALLAISAMGFHSLLLARQGVEGSVRQVRTGLYLGAAVWMKMSGLVLIPLGLLGAKVGSARIESESGGDRWIGRWRIVITALAVIAPLFVIRTLMYGLGGTSIIERYTPEATLGVSGGGVLHPVMAAKFFFHYIAAPLELSWGGYFEKVVSLLLIGVTCVASFVGLRQIWRSEHRTLILGAIILLVGALVYHNLTHFQVEPRLFVPVATAISLLVGWGFSILKFPLTLQAIIWMIPTLAIPILSSM